MSVALTPVRLPAQDHIVPVARYHHEPVLTEFDAPGAAKTVSKACIGNFYAGVSCGTTAFSINDEGVSVGYFSDKNVVPHAFARDREGRFLVFDAPGAGLGHGLDEGTVAYAINDSDSIAGQFEDSKFVFHGFVRGARGVITDFDVDGAGKGAGQGTIAWDINASDETAGFYVDGKNVFHDFVRSHEGTVTSFDPPGSVSTTSCPGTCLNDAGQVTGGYTDAKGIERGFLRERDGAIAEFGVPGAPGGTWATSISFNGTIAGYYVDAKSVTHLFVRFPNGKLVTFNAPTSKDANSVAYSINRWNAIAGQTGNLRGFEIFPDGHVKLFAPPNAVWKGGPTPNFGTRPSANNARGEIAGWYYDSAGLSHGFIWSP
jgi:hypothetical protein